MFFNVGTLQIQLRKRTETRLILCKCRLPFENQTDKAFNPITIWRELFGSHLFLFRSLSFWECVLHKCNIKDVRMRAKLHRLSFLSTSAQPKEISKIYLNLLSWFKKLMKRLSVSRIISFHNLTSASYWPWKLAECYSRNFFPQVLSFALHRFNKSYLFISAKRNFYLIHMFAKWLNGSCLKK